MTSNCNGNYPTTTEAMMAAFDKLPLLVRMALANGLDDYIPQVLLTEYRRGESVTDLILLLHDWDAQEREEHWYRMDRLARNGTPYFDTIRRRKPKT